MTFIGLKADSLLSVACNLVLWVGFVRFGFGIPLGKKEKFLFSRQPNEKLTIVCGFSFFLLSLHSKRSVELLS